MDLRTLSVGGLPIVCLAVVCAPPGDSAAVSGTPRMPSRDHGCPTR